MRMTDVTNFVKKELRGQINSGKYVEISMKFGVMSESYV